MSKYAALSMRLSSSKVMLLAILFMGLFLRIYDLENESIWLDEGHSIRWANLNLSQMIEEISVTDNPLHLILLHGWINLFGDSEFSTRFLSVVFGFLAIFMIYKVGSLIFDNDVGIVSALLLGLSVFHIRYSQEARPYSLMVLLTLLSMYFFIKLLKKRNLMLSTGYVLFSVLLMYTHILSVFIIIAQNIYLITLFLLSRGANRPNLKGWILLQVILVGLLSPWLVTISMLSMMQGVSWVSVPSISSIIRSFSRYSGSGLLFLFFIILSCASILTYKKVRGSIDWKDVFGSVEGYRWRVSLSNVDRIYLLLLWLFTPIILPFVISQFLTPIYHTRYSMGVSLAFYLLVAKGIKNISLSKAIKPIVVSLIIIFSLVNVWNYYNKVNKEQWREVANYVESNAKPGDIVLFNAGFTQVPFDYYSEERTGLIKKSFPEGFEVNEENIKELDPVVEDHNRVWLIFSHRNDRAELINEALGESYNLSDHKKYVGINVYLWEYREPR